MSLALTFWLRMDRFADIREDFEWLVVAYAAPGSGILCIELLNPTFSGMHPRDAQIIRSSIIQQLSLLMGYLHWIGPEHPIMRFVPGVEL